MVFIIVWEVLPDKSDELFSNNRFRISAVLWVEPYNFSVSIFSKVLSMVMVIKVMVNVMVMVNVHYPLVLFYC